LTVSAVSLALRGERGVSEATRARIQETAVRMGYRPDPALHVLTDLRWHRDTTLRRPNLAVYLPVDPWKSGENTALFVIEGVKTAATSLGYGVELVFEEEHPDPEKLAPSLLARGVQALLILFTARWHQWRPALDPAAFAAIALGSVPPELGLHQVRVNFYQATRESWSRLQAKGYQRIGFCHVASKPPAEIDERRMACIEWLQRHETEAAYRVPIFNLRTKSEAQFKKWLDRYEPEVILSTVPNLPVLERCITGQRPHYTLAANTRVPGMTNSLQEVGKAAVAMADAQFRLGNRGKPTVPQTLLIASSWQDQPSEIPTLGQADTR